MRRIITFAVSVAFAASTLVAASPVAQAAGMASRLLSAAVPSMCDYPAGHLVDGRLPGTEPGNIDLDRRLTRTGNLIKGGGTGAAAVFHCSQGGVGWPDHVVFYDRNLSIIGHFDSFSIGVDSERAGVRSVSIHKRTVTVRLVAVGQPGDNGLWGSAGAQVTYAWDGKKKSMTRRKVTIYRESATARKVVSLVRQGKKASGYADPATLAGLKATLRPQRSSDRPKRVTVTQCSGPYSASWFAEQYIGLGSRGCLVTVTWKNGNTSVYLLLLEHPAHDVNWTRWRAVGFPGIAG